MPTGSNGCLAGRQALTWRRARAGRGGCSAGRQCGQASARARQARPRRRTLPHSCMNFFSTINDAVATTLPPSAHHEGQRKLFWSTDGCGAWSRTLPLDQPLEQ